jgi:hypothetical protein
MLLALVPALAEGKIVNVELKFTPYVGDAAKAAKVETVPGTADIFLNGVPYAVQDVGNDSVPVMSAGREIAPAVWLPIDSLGPAVRKGKNVVRIEFTPSDADKSYHARLTWGSVTDEERTSEKNGKHRATNTTDVGKQDKSGKGKVVFEHEVDADFADDVPWHHYPAVTTVGDEDKQKLTALVMARVGIFKPPFAEMYRILEADDRLNVDKMREAKCVDAAYAAGVRVDVPTAEQLEFVTTGNPEVVVRRKTGNLFAPADPSAFGKIEGDDAQMCAGVALSLAFPPKLVAVRTPEGSWKVVY